VTSEFELIQRYFAKPVVRAALGAGDDCALLYAKPGVQLALSTDMLVEGTHFLAGTDPEKLGHKTLAVNLSDLAAMGADPAYALLAISLPVADEAWVEAFSRGFLRLAAQHGVELVGGDTTRGPLVLSVTVIGEIPSGLALRRDGALEGDDVWLSGMTGEAALALAHLQGRTQLDGSSLERCLERLDTPTPRVELGGRLRGLANCAIDVSDGLAGDLQHIAEASKVRMELRREWIPCPEELQKSQAASLAMGCLLAGGDDYELAFTALASRREELASLSRELRLRLTRIGVVTGGRPAVEVLDTDGRPMVLPRRGYDHFASAS
jgi:thiamine-monophosphate kinase